MEGTLSKPVERRQTIPVSVLLERRLIRRKFWSSHSWYLAGVVVGSELKAADGGGRIAYRTETGDVFSFSGFQVTLYQDACERYWHALIGDRPKVYVVCRDSDEDPDPEQAAIEPIRVTLDYDEATAFAETDDLVLSTTIPGELYRYMEAFVVHRYQPKPFKKRRRKRWSEAEQSQRQSPS